MKAAIVAAEVKRRQTMRLINVADLTFKTTAELIAMIREVSESLQYMHVASDEYRATISSLQIIKRALAARRMSGPKF